MLSLRRCAGKLKADAATAELSSGSA